MSRGCANTEIRMSRATACRTTKTLGARRGDLHAGEPDLGPSANGIRDFGDLIDVRHELLRFGQSRALGARREAMSVGIGDRLSAIPCAGLAVQMVDVALHGGFGDGQALGDVGV